MNELTLFAAALERDPSLRGAFLEGACGGNAELLHRVERLLEAHGNQDFMDQPAGALLATQANDPAQPLGAEIGPYKLRELIGEGGMGVVYVAEQEKPIRRKVALKIIKPGMDSREVLARFDAERQALALMDHPNIARVLDGGATESGRSYFVMELVRGVPITEFCDQRKLTTHARLELFVQVCSAIHHAHQKGIIHRDIKPSNVLVTLHDDKAVPKVIDFGVAKAVNQRLTEQTIYTAFTQMLGTPLYMSPEQAEMNALDVDTRSDVYSLGVLLYELLTGVTPFDSQTLKQAAFDEMRRIIREVEPPRPSTRFSTLEPNTASTTSQRRGADPRQLSELLRGELDWIVMKALEKDRTRRYESASAFIADVQRYLNDEAVQACPPSARYRFQKFARRNKAALGTSALVVAVLILGAGVSVWQAWEATQARKVADERLKAEIKARSEADEQRKRADVFLEQALAAIDQMLTRVSDDKLVDVPHMDTIRRDLREDAVRLYRNLAKESPEDLQVEAALGNAVRSLAHAQDGIDAEQSYRESLAIFQSVARRAPTDKQYAADVADAYRFLGWILWQTGTLEESEAASRESLRLGEQAYRDLPDAQRRIAQSKLILGIVLTYAKKFTEAEQLLQEVLPFHEKDFAQSPYRWWSLAINLQTLGPVAASHGKDSEAEAFLTSGKDVTEKYLDFLSRNPNVSFTSEIVPPDAWFEMRSKSKAQFYFVWACLHLGDFQENVRKPEEAQENYREAVRIATALVADLPDVLHYTGCLRVSEEKLVNSLCATGRSDEAVRLVAEFPSLERGLDAPDKRANVNTLFNDWGERLQQVGQFAVAEAVYKRAIAISERLTAEFPENVSYWRQYANSYDRLAKLLAATGRPNEAKEAYDKVLAGDNEVGRRDAKAGARTLNKRARSLSNSTDLKLRDPNRAVEFGKRAVELSPEEGACWNTLGAAQYRAGNWKEAIAALEKSMELENGGNSLDWLFLAMADSQIDQKEEARKWYDRAVEWMEKNQPENEELRRFRAEAAEVLGIHDEKPPQAISGP